MTETHDPDPHHTPQGDWICAVCKWPLKGSYLRPVIPWEHRPVPTVAADETALPGLGTTE